MSFKKNIKVVNMKKNISWSNSIILFSMLFCSLQQTMASSSVNLQSTVLNGGKSEAIFKGFVKPKDYLQNTNQDNFPPMIFEDNQLIDISISITVDPIDEAQRSELFLIVKHNQQWFYLDSGNKWQSMTDDMSNLKSFLKKSLLATESINLNSNQLFGPGEYLIYSGYLNHQSKLVYNQQALGFIIFSENTPSLHQIQSKQLFTDYFKLAFKGKTYVNYAGNTSNTIGAPTTASFSTHISNTSLQEQGVDEADVIKTNGEQLFVLDNCQKSSQKNCLSVYQLNESPASSQFISEHQFSAGNTIGSLYLSKIETEQGEQEIAIRVSGSRNFYWPWWNYSGNWQSSETGINIIDISNPQAMQSIYGITLDGNLVSSRRIGNMLYVVTRISPAPEGYKDWYPSEPTYSISQEEIDANQKLIENLSINDIIPKINFHTEEPIALYQAEDCFLPPHTSDKQADRNIISIVAIPLDQPREFQANCIIGSSESFYASNEAIYLASTRYQYDITELDYRLKDPTEQYKTDIHKFSITNQTLEYKGSGIVPGHFGWELNKKPFRMSEYNGQLRVATSLGNRWDNTTSTSLTILQEASNSAQLERIGGIDGIGKPGEILYSSHFIDTRGYFVAAEKTAPLYVLNLEDGSRPEIMAELEVEGFSEYLHPVNDNYLLGIGKTTTPATDEQGNELGYSWDQGLELSLFDVSDDHSVTKIQSMKIGKQPTSSNVLYDHHAFTYIEPHDNSPARFAIPVDLYDTAPLYSSWFDPDNPNAYYDWTHIGLYVFDLNLDNTPNFQLTGKLITAEAIPDYYYTGPHYGHSVIQGDSVHFYYDHQIYSRAISDLE